MLFSSYQFIFFFLPIAFLVFIFVGALGYHRLAMAWLVAASLFFYGWWNPSYLGLIIGSILFNYALGTTLSKKYSGQQSSANQYSSRVLLFIGVAGNLGLIAYYKYFNFFIDSLNYVTSTDFNTTTIILPLAISFFTFQQIAFLVDAYRGETKEYNFLQYCLFVTFFPQLIAGPIVHHKEMLPQFIKKNIYRLNTRHLAIGLAIFSMGLFKKVVLADSIGAYATPIFEAAEAGAVLTIFEAWGGALAYTFQLYFDFSGYSDMAIGLARMFGVRLPLNFNSPYKAKNIIEFWRRWHITLSRFLRDYLYIPLGGSRKGPNRRFFNLFVTMLLGGLWHGAGWTFVVWGSLHGIYLIINHGWIKLTRTFSILKTNLFFGTILARTITFLAVVISWVFFRAESVESAVSILSSMSGLNGVSVPFQLAERLGAAKPLLESLGVQFDGVLVLTLSKWLGGSLLIIILGLIAFFAPNTQQIMIRYRPAFETYKGEISASGWRFLQWRLSRTWAFVTAVLSTVAILGLLMNRSSEFLYFNF